MKGMKLLLALTILSTGCGGAGEDAGPVTTPGTSAPSTTTSAAASTTAATSDTTTTSSPGRSASCSAGSLSEDVPEPPGLPAPVAMMRKEILKAAVNCDFQLLEALAFRPSGAFQYSTTEESAGPDAQPARYWREREAGGERPMAVLVEILNGAPEITGVREPEGPGSGSDVMYYTWPRNPRPDGYRTSITSEGDWIFFLRQR